MFRIVLFDREMEDGERCNEGGINAVIFSE